MVYLDERSVIAERERALLEKALAEDRQLRRAVARFAEVRASAVSARQAAEARNAALVDEYTRARNRFGWTVLALDVHGPPFGPSGRPTSHGAWARHDACGAVQKLEAEPGAAPAHPRTGRAATAPG